MAVNYTVPQFDAAVKVAEDCKHNKLDHMACAQCFAQHLAEIGAGARPDAQFMEEYRQVYEEVVKLRAAEDKHAEEMIVLAEALTEARAAAHVESEYATKARTHIDTLDAIKAERDKAKKRHEEISTKYREVRDTLKDVLDGLKKAQDDVREATEALAKSNELMAETEKTVTKLTRNTKDLRERLEEVTAQCHDLAAQRDKLTADLDEWKRIAQNGHELAMLWGVSAYDMRGYLQRKDRQVHFKATVRTMVANCMGMNMTKPDARKWTADFLRRVRDEEDD